MKGALYSIIIIACIISLFIYSGSSHKLPGNNNIINGVSFVAPRDKIDSAEPGHVKNIGATWMAVIPYAFLDGKNPELIFNHNHQWWGEREEGVAETIRYARMKGLKILIKPHVWVRGAGWAGDFELDNEDDWRTWEKGYSNYIMTYAHLADSLDADMFCIGTEFRKAAVQRKAFWIDLIHEVRKIYKGPATYAANWDNYENISFWNELDYIGIDAYFPLSSSRTPGVNELVDNWKPISKKIENFSRKEGKEVLFTEYGYQSIDFTSDGHWKYDQDTLAVNLTAQANAYQALYTTFWDKNWFAGGFLWKWHSPHDKYGGPECKRYTPQNKPAELTIENWYKNDLTP